MVSEIQISTDHNVNKRRLGKTSFNWEIQKTKLLKERDCTEILRLKKKNYEFPPPDYSNCCSLIELLQFTRLFQLYVSHSGGQNKVNYHYC